jgi:hypothetical protein
MKRFLGLLIATAFLAVAQGETTAAYTPNPHVLRDSVIRISIGGGATFSTINMGLEPIGEVKHGWNGRVSVKFKRRIGLTAEYTYQLVHDALPAWGGIIARNFDLNMHFLYYNVAATEAKFYGIFGFSYQQWSGVYQGTPAFDRDVYDYKPGDQVKFNWPALNVGIGFERFYNHVGMFGEFKFRGGQDYSSDPFAIVDVCITAGIRINLLAIGNIYKNAPPPHKHSHKMGIKPKIYHWF